MLFFLILFAQAAEPTNSSFAGTWVNDKADVRLVLTDKAGALNANLEFMGSTAASGVLEGTGNARTAPLEGCGGTFTLGPAGHLKVALNGPDCAVDFVGDYRRLPATHCGAKVTTFTCSTKKAKVISVCAAPDGALSYAYGAVGKVELSLDNGTFAERNLAGGTEYNWAFTNNEYSYGAFVVESRPQDTGAGVLIEKSGATIATVTCAGEWFRK